MSWARDLTLGARLAVGGRGGLIRVVLTAVGVGLGVAVLLLTVSLVNADNARKARESARLMQTDQAGRTGEPALLTQPAGIEFRDQQIRGDLLDVVAPNPPIPPGLDRLPGHGEVFVSPALAELLAAPDGALLRPRIPWRVVGTIDKTGLVDPSEKVYYAGASLPRDDDSTRPVYGFGEPLGPSLPLVNLLFALTGGLLLLIPVFVLVGAATRIAASAREQRLAALRLVGADANQTRRIATGEALVGSVAGVLLGSVLFLFGGRLGERLSLFGYGAFAEDLRPSAVGVVLIAIAVPTLAVVAGLIALRHTISQPLGVTRQSTPALRSVWWRLAPLLIGVVLMLPQAGAFVRSPGRGSEVAVLVGLVLVAVSVPLLLPWLLQRAVAPLAGGPPSWQLAVRRLQLDSGTPARAAGGLAALLTTAVGLQSLFATALAAPMAPADDDRGRVVEVGTGQTAVSEPVLAGLADINGVREADTYRLLFANLGQDAPTVRIVVATCPVLGVFARLDSCADGDVFVAGTSAPSQEVIFSRWERSSERPTEVGRWTVPAHARSVQLTTPADDGAPGAILVTPAGLPSTAPDELFVNRTRLVVDPTDRDVIEHIRNAVLPLGPDTGVLSAHAGASSLVGIRNLLLAGSVIVLLLAAASLLIVSIEQVRERRQQLAALAAAGVAGRTLAASVLWQALVPFGVAVVAAIGIGVGLSALVLRVFDIPFTVDWVGTGTLTAASALAVLLVTVLTLPSLRAATRPESLRME